MRVLILNTSDNTGGAAIAARRLLHALVAEGHEARMLVRDRTTDDPLVSSVGGRFSKAIDRARIWAANGFSRDRLWLTDAAWHGCRVTRHPLFEWADVIHLHWVNQGFLSMDEIGRILHSGKRVVWTMHDLWPVSGVCHYAADCTRFHTLGCGHCPQLLRPAAHDLSARTFERKAQLYADADVTFVACSRWLANQARCSAIAQGHRVVTIPNTIDTDVWAPEASRNVEECREMSRVIENYRELSRIIENYRSVERRPRILFSSANVNDERKGMPYLLQALAKLRDLDLELVVVGQNSATVAQLAQGGTQSDEATQGFTVHSIPYLSDPREMAALNASVDVFVTPSLQDNLPNTIMEAMACGTPCVGFDVGGIPEMIDHLRNGYVARLRDADDLADGIRQALANNAAWSVAARRKVLDSYSSRAVVAAYDEVYQPTRQQQ